MYSPKSNKDSFLEAGNFLVKISRIRNPDNKIRNLITLTVQLIRQSIKTQTVTNRQLLNVIESIEITIHTHEKFICQVEDTELTILNCITEILQSNKVDFPDTSYYFWAYFFVKRLNHRCLEIIELSLNCLDSMVDENNVNQKSAINQMKT
ncbi:hypothetical protein GJ496_007627 [Pomphorhynchus laevis]|nr:hypothetical protein GJ496_007627 [Pomphorhynchus laevis]